jgi:hypothetical protein
MGGSIPALARAHVATTCALLIAGEEWDKTKAYFARAWPAVMANLEKRFQPK